MGGARDDHHLCPFKMTRIFIVFSIGQVALLTREVGQANKVKEAEMAKVHDTLSLSTPACLSFFLFLSFFFMDEPCAGMRWPRVL